MRCTRDAPSHCRTGPCKSSKRVNVKVEVVEDDGEEVDLENTVVESNAPHKSPQRNSGWEVRNCLAGNTQVLRWSNGPPDGWSGAVSSKLGEFVTLHQKPHSSKTTFTEHHKENIFIQNHFHPKTKKNPELFTLNPKPLFMIYLNPKQTQFHLLRVLKFPAHFVTSLTREILATFVSHLHHHFSFSIIFFHFLSFFFHFLSFSFFFFFFVGC